MDCLSDDSDSQRHLRAGSISYVAPVLVQRLAMIIILSYRDACPSRQYWDYNESTPPPSPLSLVEETMVSIAKGELALPGELLPVFTLSDLRHYHDSTLWLRYVTRSCNVVSILICSFR